MDEPETHFAASLTEAAKNTPTAGNYTGELYICFGEQHSTQRWDNGTLATWEPSGDGPWTLRVPAGTEPAQWTDPHVGAASTLTAHGRCGPVGPFDTDDTTVFSQMPRIRYATLAVNTVLTHSPWGTVWARLGFTDGNVTETSTGAGEPPAEPTVTATMSWEGYHRWRAGADILEVIALTGDVTGKWTELLCLHGLVQDPAWTAAVDTLVPVPDTLTQWAAQAGAV